MDLIYGIPQDLLDDWFEDSSGDNYSIAKLRVVDADQMALVTTLIEKQTDVIDLLLKERDTQSEILIELKRLNMYYAEGFGNKFTVEDIDQ